MRARAVRMIVSVVAVVCVVMGLPGAFLPRCLSGLPSSVTWKSLPSASLQSIDRRNAAGESTDAESVAALVADQNEGRDELSYRILVPGPQPHLRTRPSRPGAPMTAFAESPSGVSASSPPQPRARLPASCGRAACSVLA